MFVVVIVSTLLPVAGLLLDGRTGPGGQGTCAGHAYLSVTGQADTVSEAVTVNRPGTAASRLTCALLARSPSRPSQQGVESGVV